MKPVKILDGYSFTFDGSCYTLLNTGTRYKIDRKTRKQTDELYEYTDTLGYFSSIDEMLNKCLKVASNDLAESRDCETLEEYMNCISDIFAKISNFTESWCKNNEVSCARKSG